MKTKAIESYREIKKSHPDYLPVVLVGDFYETFYEDAERLAKIAELTVTTMGRKGETSIPMTGFPSYMLAEVAQKLTAFGIKTSATGIKGLAYESKRTKQSTIRIHSGKYMDLRNPSVDDIHIEDIACGLSKICRFGGQIERFYSVAEHSVHCAEVALEDGYGPETVFAVFMHDAAEAYIGDVVRPLKAMLSEFAAIEERIFTAIQQRFNFAIANPVVAEVTQKVIAEIDNSMLHAERRRLFPPDGERWTGDDKARSIDVPCYCWPHQKAFKRFMEMFDLLSAMRA